MEPICIREVLQVWPRTPQLLALEGSSPNITDLHRDAWDFSFGPGLNFDLPGQPDLYDS